MYSQSVHTCMADRRRGEALNSIFDSDIEVIEGLRGPYFRGGPGRPAGGGAAGCMGISAGTATLPGGQARASARRAVAAMFWPVKPLSANRRAAGAEAP